MKTILTGRWARRVWAMLSLGTVLAVMAGQLPAGRDPEVRPEQKDLRVNGKLVAANGVSLHQFNLQPGGVLEWPNKLRISHGGGASSGLPPRDGAVRAQPGGNIVLQPQGDYMRCAIDLLPTRGKQADMDAIGEFTIHRVLPTATTQEMIS